MISIINLIVLVLSTIMTLLFYLISVSPAALERIWGEKAYRRCALFRFLTGFWMVVTTSCYLVYKFFPLPLPLAPQFPWQYRISLLIALIITIPAVIIHIKGVLDAGRETLIPDKSHRLYRGVYKHIRHPQAVGEVVIYWTIAFLLNSPFLAIYSFVFIPVFYLMCVAEERDLLIRYGRPYADYRAQTGMFFPRFNR